MLIQIQAKKGTSVEVLHEVDELGVTNEIIELGETQQIRVRVEDWESDVSIRVGQLELIPYQSSSEDVLFFSRGDIPKDALKKSDFFCPIFTNQIGNTFLEIVSDEIEVVVPLKITSYKTDEDEVITWLNKITSIFPFFKTPLLMSPIASISASSRNDSPFQSLSSFLNEGRRLLSGIEQKVFSEQYLQKKFQRVEAIGSVPDVKKFAKNTAWAKPGTIWIKHKRTNSFANPNLSAFEPLKHPSLASEISFDTPLNKALLDYLNFSIATIQRQRKRFQIHEEQIVELRGQFGDTTSKYNLHSSFRNSLDELEKLAQKIVNRLSHLKVTPSQNRKPISFDPRYKSLVLDIERLERFIRNFRIFDSLGDQEIGLMGLDYIFEFFVYSEILSILMQFGFQIEDIGESFPINHYVKLRHKNGNVCIRVLHDHHVPKSTEKLQNVPIWDFWKTGPKLCPDFIVHIFTEDHEQVFIFDAKYMSQKNAKDKFNSFIKTDSLQVKYGTKFFLSGEHRNLPTYLGAICCAPPEKFNSTHEWLIDNDANPSQKSGVTEINGKDSSALSILIEELLAGFELYQKIHPKGKTSDTSRPLPTVFESSKIFNRRKPKIRKIDNSSLFGRRTLSHTAPSLTEEDASIIKGMLKRGDIPQDICFFFGVNPGRISDIKSGKTFLEVSPADAEKLPRPGPYPAIKDLL